MFGLVVKILLLLFDFHALWSRTKRMEKTTKEKRGVSIVSWQIWFKVSGKKRKKKKQEDISVKVGC